MFFDYGEDEIIRDIDQYLKSGAYPYCCDLPYADAFEKFIDEDKREALKVGNSGGYKTALLIYNKLVNRQLSGLNHRTHKLSAFKEVFATWGKGAGDDLKEVGLYRGSKLAKFLTGTTYAPILRDLNKGTYGYCFYNQDMNKALVLSDLGNTPLQAAIFFYHETAHTLEQRFNNFGREYDVLIRNSGKSGKANSGNEEYYKYFSESYAETFALANVLLKAKTESEYQQLRGEVLKYAQLRMVGGCGSETAAYNCYPMTVAMISQFDKLGRIGRNNFCKTGAVRSPEKLNAFTADLVRKYAYPRKEFDLYRTSKWTIEQLQQQDKKPGFAWVGDLLLCKSSNDRSYSKKDELLDFKASLQKAKSQRQIYNILHRKYTFCNAEVRQFRETYEKSSLKGRTYAKLRRAEKIVGVDKLFGKFARKRRSLGRKIMEKLNEGR